MLFNSINFLIFFPIVIFFYFIVPAKYNYIWLLIASYYFYMGWNPKYVLLLLACTTITYLSSIAIEYIRNTYTQNNSVKLSRICIFVGIVLNLLLLFYFKYFNFVMTNIRYLFSKFNITIINHPFDIVLPVGISFFTFQAIGYTIDVYKNKIKAEKNFLKYALFVSFFPQLVAGPIERSKNLLKQFETPKVFEYERVKDGLLLMLFGYFEKIIIADRISLIVNSIYNNYETNKGGGINCNSNDFVCITNLL